MTSTRVGRERGVRAVATFFREDDFLVLRAISPLPRMIVRLRRHVGAAKRQPRIQGGFRIALRTSGMTSGHHGDNIAQHHYRSESRFSASTWIRRWTLPASPAPHLLIFIPY